METEVYGDILFLINSGMDLLCFLLTARLLRRRLSRLRLFIGAALGGAYAVLALLIEVGQAVALLLDISVCFLLCLIVFPPEKGRRGAWLSAAGVYLLVSLLLGGMMTGLYNLLNRTALGRSLTDAGADGTTAWLFLLLAAGSGVFAAWGGRLFHREGAARGDPATVEITLNSRTITVEGMVDSGNLLTDPMGGMPVIPVDDKALRPLLSPALRDALTRTVPGWDNLSAVPEATRLRLIPIATATGEGLLVAIRPEQVNITIKSPKGDRVRQVDALVAPTPHTPGALVPGSLT